MRRSPVYLFAILSLALLAGCGASPERPDESTEKLAAGPQPAASNTAEESEAAAQSEAVAAAETAAASTSGEVDAAETATAAPTFERYMPPEPWRKTRPTPGKAPEITPPEFARKTLPNGLTVLVSERHDLPLLSIGIALRSGSASDPEGKAGLAELTYEMLLEGAGRRDAFALDEAFGELGTTPHAGAGPDGGSVSVRVLKRNATRALRLLSEVVQRPTFDKGAFERRKKKVLADLARMAGNPQFLAREAFAATVFGETHPYGHPSSGTPKSVESITLKDVKNFYKNHFGPKNAALIVTGDVTLAEAVRWAKKYFGRWRGRARPPEAPSEPEVRRREHVVLVPKAGLNQTIVVWGRPAVPAGHPDEFALRLANDVFGGQFSARLNMNLREDKGYTYGAYGWYDGRRGAGVLAAYSAVRADVTGPALAEFVKETKGIVSNPITPEEMEAAREGEMRRIPGKFETVDALASTASTLFQEGLPLDRIERMITAFEGMSLDAVRAAAEKYFQVDAMQLVLVGDPGIVKEQVPPLGLGDLLERPPLGVAEPAKTATSASAQE